jgi:hypothetical protein
LKQQREKALTHKTMNNLQTGRGLSQQKLAFDGIVNLPVARFIQRLDNKTQHLKPETHKIKNRIFWVPKSHKMETGLVAEQCRIQMKTYTLFSVGGLELYHPVKMVQL